MLKLMVMGQALMAHDIRQYDPVSFAQMQNHFQKADVCFTDLEVSVLGGGAPTKEEPYFHAAEPEVLDGLYEMGFRLLALCNNHAWDLGTEGILHTRQEVERRNIVGAGTGVNLEVAACARFLKTDKGCVALVGMASGGLRGNSMATETRAGVNPLRLDTETRKLDAVDMDRNLSAIRTASEQADVVIAYHHAHHWEPDWQDTPDWQRAWAHQCIDAGATTFVAHGVPLLHGVEWYQNCPIFYSLGNFVFHTKTDPGHYDHRVWESAVVTLHIDRGKVVDVEVYPVVLNELGRDGGDFYKTRGFPKFAEGEKRLEILKRWANLSEVYQTDFEFDDLRANIVVPER